VRFQVRRRPGGLISFPSGLKSAVGSVAATTAPASERPTPTRSDICALHHAFCGVQCKYLGLQSHCRLRAYIDHLYHYRGMPSALNFSPQDRGEDNRAVDASPALHSSACTTLF
jgi:hypothetical protein